MGNTAQGQNELRARAQAGVPPIASPINNPPPTVNTLPGGRGGNVPIITGQGMVNGKGGGIGRITPPPPNNRKPPVVQQQEMVNLNSGGGISKPGQTRPIQPNNPSYVGDLMGPGRGGIMGGVDQRPPIAGGVDINRGPVPGSARPISINRVNKNRPIY